MEHENKRPAWKTSAFWVPIIIGLLPVVENLLKVLPPNSSGYTFGMMIIAAAYSFSRNNVYKSRNDASAAFESAKLLASAPASGEALPFTLDLSDARSDTSEVLAYAG